MIGVIGVAALEQAGFSADHRDRRGDYAPLEQAGFCVAYQDLINRL